MSATISELDADYGPGGAAGVQLKTVGQVHRLALDTLIEVDCATFDDILSRNGLANLSGQRHQLMPFIHSAKTDGNLAATDDLTETPAQILRGLVSVHCHAALELIATRSEATLAECLGWWVTRLSRYQKWSSQSSELHYWILRIARENGAKDVGLTGSNSLLAGN